MVGEDLFHMNEPIPDFVRSAQMLRQGGLHYILQKSCLAQFRSSQVTTNCAHTIHVYARKFVAYTKFLEVMQSFVCQYNILLLSFIYSEPAFLIGGIYIYIYIYIYIFICCSPQSFDLNVQTVFDYSSNVMFLQSRSDLLDQHFYSPFHTQCTSQVKNIYLDSFYTSHICVWLITCALLKMTLNILQKIVLLVPFLNVFRSVISPDKYRVIKSIYFIQRKYFYYFYISE